MNHALTRIAGLSLAALVLGVGPAGAGGTGHSQTGADIKSDMTIGGSGGVGVGTPGGSLSPGGSVESDTKSNTQTDGRTDQDQPAASPRMDGGSLSPGGSTETDTKMRTDMNERTDQDQPAAGPGTNEGQSPRPEKQ